MSKPRRIAFVSLGCAKNLVDSERMLGQLAMSGYEFTNDPDDADAIVINTCGFLDASRSEAHEAITEALSHKKSGKCRRVVVAGCLVQRDGARLLQDVPGIDALVGVNHRESLADAVAGSKRKSPDLFLGEYYPRVDDDRARLRLTPSHYAYLRISEGCDQKCTFCTIPKIRGPMHSKPPENILEEAHELLADGAVELNLIGQDTTSYGQDIGYAQGLAGLLRQINDLPGLQWARLLYVYPSVLTDQMIEAIAECEHVVPYIDIPLQHINDRILKGMHRQVTTTQTHRLLEKLRQMIPGVSIRTTMIVGFPGETDAEFEQLLQFIQEFKFDALGVFPYSQESDTPAGRMKDQIPDEVKERRVEILMQTQQKVAFELAKSRVGQTFEVLVDGAPRGNMQPSRHAGQAPQVDSVTCIVEGNYDPGQLIRVRCIDAHDYDLIAQPADVILPVLS